MYVQSSIFLTVFNRPVSFAALLDCSQTAQLVFTIAFIFLQDLCSVNPCFAVSRVCGVSNLNLTASLLFVSFPSLLVCTVKNPDQFDVEIKAGVRIKQFLFT